MHRFFIPAEWIDQEKVVIKGKLVPQLRNVLRLRGGDHIIVLDDTGWEYEVELEGVTRDHFAGVICRQSPAAEPGTKITLYQALLKGSNFEFILQKCTELGVSAFVPVICERCVAGHLKDKRVERWQRIIVEAAEQSRRGRLPKLEPALPFEQACQSAMGFSLLAWEGESEARGNQNVEMTSGLHAVLRSEIYRQRIISEKTSLSVNLFIGPEGGLSPSEVEFARGCGILPISLGSRILRAETAGLVAASAILYECGDLDPPMSSVIACAGSRPSKSTR
jgi:16S rRNA (uracil1498-N3)-methyltransferase